MTAYIAPHYSYQDRKISRSIWYAAFLAVPNTAALWNLLIIRQALHTLSSSSRSHVSIRLYDDGPHYRVILDFTSWSPDIWTWWTKSSLMSSPSLVCIRHIYRIGANTTALLIITASRVNSNTKAPKLLNLNNTTASWL